MLARLNAFNDRLASGLLWLGGAGLCAMTAIVGWQVFARYVLNDSPNWSEQLTLLLMLWYALLASAAGFQKGFHIRIIAGQVALGEKRARQLRMLVELLVVTTGLLCLIPGLTMAQLFATHSIPSLGISRFWAYMPIPVAGAFIILFGATRLYGEIVQPGWTRPADIDDAAAGPEAAV